MDKKEIIIKNLKITYYAIVVYIFFILFGITIIILDFIFDNNYIITLNEYAKFITNWGFILCFFYSIIKLILRKTNKYMNVYFNIIFVLEAFITVFYWSIIAPKRNFINNPKIYSNVIRSVLIHILPFLFTIFELFSDKNIQLEYINIIYIIIIQLIYLAINYIYTSVFNDKVYEVLSFRDLFSVFIILISILFVIIVHLLVTYLKKKYKKI